MTTPNISREEMWAQQGLLPQEIDYRVWERDKTLLLQMDKMYGSCTFVVDVCKGRYTFASSNFVDLLEVIVLIFVIGVPFEASLIGRQEISVADLFDARMLRQSGHNGKDARPRAPTPIANLQIYDIFRNFAP